MAPQVLEGEYSSQADMWAFGVISYMVSNQSPENKKTAFITQRSPFVSPILLY
jgi:serine/threonine protein kinase